jgi:predicted Zn-ribbon and HTH transcriptional regulator
MVKKFTSEDIVLKVKERNHDLIKISNINDPMKGHLTLRCFCGKEFEKSALNYFKTKNGCPACKSKTISESNKKRWAFRQNQVVLFEGGQ